MPIPSVERAKERTQPPDKSRSMRQRPLGADTPSSILGLQQAVGNRATGRLVARSLPAVVDRGGPGDGMQVQRKCQCEDQEEEIVQTRADTEGGSPGSESEAAAPANQAAVVVEDDATEVGPGQMKKSEFLARLRPAVLAAAESGLTDKSRLGEAGALADRYVGQYEAMDVAQINTALSRAVPGERPTTAEGYISAIADRARSAAAHWQATGELPEAPSLSDLGIGGGGLMGGLLGGIGGAIFGARARIGGLRDSHDPVAVRARLGAGRPLDSSVRSRMESIFGRSFASVRLHTDSAAAGLSSTYHAQAFTVGSHIAFGAQKYRPGTLIGDALIAHELAHVTQQADARPGEPLRAAASGYQALENDADLTTVAAAARMWRGMRSMVRGLPAAGPRLRSGLQLQRCENCNCNCSPQQTTAQPPQTRPSQPSTPGRPAACEPTPADYQTVKTEGQLEGTLGYTKINRDAGLICMPNIVASSPPGTCTFTPPTLSLPLTSKYVKPGDYPSGMSRSVPGCTSQVPIVFRISKETSDLARKAEQEHCADLKLAFDRTLKPCGDALARFQGTPLAGQNSDQCFADLVQKLGFHPLACTEEFVTLQAATDQRDAQDWHTFDPQIVSHDCTKVVAEFNPSAQTRIDTVPSETHVPQATKCGSGTAPVAPQAAPTNPQQPPPRP